MPLVGGGVTEANILHFFAPRRQHLNAPHDLGHKMNGFMLVKNVMLELYEVANFNTMILSHCACSTIEIPVTVITPFVH